MLFRFLFNIFYLKTWSYSTWWELPWRNISPNYTEEMSHLICLSNIAIIYYVEAVVGGVL